jgi:hypothetical protein
MNLPIPSSLIPAFSQGEGETSAAASEKPATGLAGRASAKPEPAKADFLSWGERIKVRADVKHKLI